MKLSNILALCALAVTTGSFALQSTPPPDSPAPAPATVQATSTSTDEGQNAGRGCGMGMRQGQGAMHGRHGNRGAGGGRGSGRSAGKGAGMGADRDNIHSLLAAHASIKRSIADIPTGVRTETTSEEAGVADTIREHVRQMYARLENGQPIRMMDPLFREIFANAEKIEMKIEDIPGGVRVTETSKDPNVVLLIRQHAKAVDGFVSEGMAKMHEPSALPEGYKAK